ncbi:YdeI/OmpD-associated family protein [Mesorhizobium sp. L48C026A00]|uniref:YdeI/OmpD-associated family protein n=1 Tax=Mesorhizobium sp. L48C026A00 TaxID=1287182 RepID=UPI001FD931D9|nr:YdeI/OmpD-associated family protein [Mesorhizobium sp. L48C026A00]
MPFSLRRTAQRTLNQFRAKGSIVRQESHAGAGVRGYVPALLTPNPDKLNFAHDQAETRLEPDAGRHSTALTKQGLMTAYDDRPDYQKNDYLGWIARAKRAETRHKRPRCWTS